MTETSVWSQWFCEFVQSGIQSSTTRWTVCKVQIQRASSKQGDLKFKQWKMKPLLLNDNHRISLVHSGSVQSLKFKKKRKRHSCSFVNPNSILHNSELKTVFRIFFAKISCFSVYNLALPTAAALIPSYVTTLEKKSRLYFTDWLFSSFHTNLLSNAVLTHRAIPDTPLSQVWPKANCP